MKANTASLRGLAGVTRGIGRTLLIYFTALTVVPLILVALIGTGLSVRSAQLDAEARLGSIADDRAQAIRAWVGERQQDLQDALNDKPTADLIQSLLREPANTSARESVTARLAKLTQNEHRFKRVFLLDQSRQTIASTDVGLLGSSHTREPYANPASPQPLALLYTDENLNKRIVFAQAIVDGQQRPIAILVAETDTQPLSDIMLSGSRMGATDETYLVGQDNRFLTATRFPHRSDFVNTAGSVEAFKRQTGAGGSSNYENYIGTPVIGAYRFIPELGVALLAEQSVAEAFATAQQQAILGVTVTLAAALITITGAYFFTRRITRPIDNLTEVAAQVAHGDLDRIAVVERNDQIGMLAQNFNTMTGRLRDMIDSLEARVELRTAQVQASADVGRAAASILDPDQLLKQVVQLITERFGFYYAAAFTLEQTGQWAVLREAAGAGDAAWLLKQAGHKLGTGGNSMVAAAIREQRARIVHDVETEVMRFANPLLPDTRSEVALPLIVGDSVLGALDVQSVEAAAFDEIGTTVLQSMADQIAVALNNAAQYRREQMRAQQTMHLLEAAVELTAPGQRTGPYQRIVELTAALLNADGAGLWQPVDQENLELTHAVGSGLEQLVGQHVQSGKGIAGRIFATGLALRLDNARTWKDSAADLGDAPVSAMLGVPMILQGQAIGVLIATNTNPGKVFTVDDANVAQLFAAQVASALENMQLVDRLQSTLSELHAVNKRLTSDAWQARTRDKEISHVYRRLIDAEPATPTLYMNVPIELRGQTIGTVMLQDHQAQRQLTEDERSIVLGVVQQMSLALESARLFEQTQAALGEARRLAQRERLINRITSQLRGAVTVDEVLRIAVDEMRHAVRASWTSVELKPSAAVDGSSRGGDHA